MIGDFEKYALSKGVNSNTLNSYANVTSAYINPSIIEERRLNIAVMDVFSRLMMERIIFLGVPINDDVANIIQAQLLYLDSEDPQKKISLYINSPGGQVYAGWSIYDTMNIIQSPVHTTCTGMAASMAAVLLASGEKGGRAALPHSRVMIHQPMGGTRGQASDIEIEAREILKTRRELYESLAQNTGKSYEEIEKDADRDYWMTAPEALKYGMIDKILVKE